MPLRPAIMASTNRNRFAGVPRGRPLPGAKAIAAHIWHNEERWRSALHLPREEYGLAIVAGELLGYSGWIDYALAVAAERRRPRTKSASKGEKVGETPTH
jgi:hypothetical protein